MKLKDLNVGQLFIFINDIELCKQRIPLYRMITHLQFIQYGVGCNIDPIDRDWFLNHEVRIIDF